MEGSSMLLVVTQEPDGTCGLGVETLGRLRALAEGLGWKSKYPRRHQLARVKVHWNGEAVASW
jgi:hypothetical protein